MKRLGRFFHRVLCALRLHYDITMPASRRGRLSWDGGVICAVCGRTLTS